MQISLIGQPYSSSSNLYRFLTDGCEDQKYTKLRFATAWAKQSGLARVQDAFSTFRARGGRIIALVGISEGGATRQGLHLVHKVSTKSYVFHDHGRTFHPKVYLFSGPEHWSILVGSNNLNAGGTFWNYEAAVQISGKLNSQEHSSLMDQVDDWFDSLIGDDRVCLPLDLELIKKLIESPEYRIGDEIRMAAKRRVRTAVDPSTDALFGKSHSEKHKDPGRSSGNGRDGEAARSDANMLALEDSPAERSEIIKHSWFKKMSASDAQRPPKEESSKATGNLKLTRARHPIDQKKYFREVFFDDAVWEARDVKRGVQEKAIVSFEVVIGASSHGIHQLVIDHAEYRVAGQNNVPTWLHWGEYLGRHLKTHDHVGDYVTIEAFEDGSRRLTISADPIGEIVSDLATGS